MDQPKYTPINPGGSLLIAWQLKGKKVVLVGGGEVAAGRIVNLLNADARITLLCPKSGLNDEVAYRINNGQIDNYIDREYKDENDLLDANLVLTAIDDVETSKKIYETAKKLNIPCNVADIPSNCDFYFGSIVRKGPLQVLISTSGQGPRISAKLKNLIENSLPPSIGTAISNIGKLRQRLRTIEPQVGGKPGLKRMKWMINVCDSYTFDQLAELNDEDLDYILQGYQHNIVPRPSKLSTYFNLPSFNFILPTLIGTIIGSSLTYTFIKR